MSADPRFLRIPMYLLSRISDVDAFAGLTAEQLKRWPLEYDAVERKAIVAALRFARDNPAYDFAALVPGTVHANPQIHRFLCTLLQSLEEGDASAVQA